MNIRNLIHYLLIYFSEIVLFYVMILILTSCFLFPKDLISDIISIQYLWKEKKCWNIFKFIDNHGSFCVNRPENTSYLLFSSCIRSRSEKFRHTRCLEVTAKIDQDTFLLEPVSSENLHNNRSSRNFWIVKEGHIPYSVTGSSAQQEADRFTDRQEDSELTAGFMWQTLKRTSRELGLISTVTFFFIPKSDNVEIMYVTVWKPDRYCTENFTAYGAIPVLRKKCG